MKLRTVTGALSAAFLFAACSSSGELSDKRLPTGSQSLATSSDFKALYVANTDHGTVGRVPLAGGARTDVAVGALPTRIARADQRLFVTVRGERKVAVLEERGDTLANVGDIDVGAEPFAVVASADGARVYVSVSLEDKVVEIDGGSLAVLREWKVSGQPRWLALHPSGESLFVASAFGGQLSWIDLVGNTVTPIDVPTPITFSPVDGTETNLSRRMTGDLAISPNGELLLAPALVVDNVSVVPEGTDGGDSEPAPIPSGYDAGRFNPVVVSVNLESDGQPIVDTVQLVSVSSFANAPVVGYPSSVAIDPASELAVVTIEGQAAAIAISIETAVPSEPGVFDKVAGVPESDAIALPGGGGRGFVGFSSRPNLAFGVPAGPRSVIFTDDSKPLVYGFLDRAVGRIDLGNARTRFDADSTNGGVAVDVGFAAPAPNGPFDRPQPSFEFSAEGVLSVADEVLNPLEVQGRRLFFAANDSRMSAGGSGVSCATCHFDGRNDGLTWNFARGARQTPSLAGKVSLQAPVRWEGDRVTVADDALKTSQGLMGGQGLTVEDSAAIEAFIDSTPEVAPKRLATDAAVQRGKAIFESPEAACATCHNGPRYTDKQKYAMAGLTSVQTRALTGIAASGPYLHNGSEATLLDLVNAADRINMGRTSHLSEQEKADLVAYLESL